jgi:hypothetical protein
MIEMLVDFSPVIISVVALIVIILAFDTMGSKCKKKFKSKKSK